MKITRIALSLMTLGLSTALFFSCDKPDNKAPEADTETQSAIDAVWATFAITDIEQVSAFVGENQLVTHFYSGLPGGYNSSNSTGSVIATRDTLSGSKSINVAFNKSWCYDGRFREGTIFWYLNYDKDFDRFAYNGIGNPNSRYPHDFGFVSRLAFSDYKVDGWDIDNDPTKLVRAFVANLMPSGYDPTKNPIEWRIRGDFNFKSPDPVNRDKDMKISVDLVKTLLNSNDTKIYNSAVKGSFINWTNANPLASTPSVATTAGLIAYSGTVCGTTSNGANFRMVIDKANPLVRDFTCYADKIGGVTVGTGTVGLVPRYNEFHPFIKGIASFTTGLDQTGLESQYAGKSSIYPRQIYFGNEDNIKDTDGNVIAPQCDNTGIVLIKGIGYQVEFKK